MNHEVMAAELANSGNYKIIRRFCLENDPRISGRPAANPRIGISLDTETTGLFFPTDKVVELAMVSFEYEASTCEITRILDTYVGFEDPGMPISPEATAVNGITDEMVRGTSFDDEKINLLVSQAHIIIAHNSGFDRRGLEYRFPIFASKPWACSLTQINWDAERIKTKSLEYILIKTGGWFVDAHRAMADTQGVLAVLLETLPVSGVPAFKAMMEKAREKSYRLYAVKAPFEAKDSLKACGYAWNDGANGKPKAWWKDVADLDSEMDFLSIDIYQGRSTAEVKTFPVDAYSRFSVREP